MQFVANYQKILRQSSESIDKNNWSLIEISKLYQYLSIDSKTLEMVEKLDKKIKDNY